MKTKLTDERKKELRYLFEKYPYHFRAVGECLDEIDRLHTVLRTTQKDND